MPVAVYLASKFSMRAGYWLRSYSLPLRLLGELLTLSAMPSGEWFGEKFPWATFIVRARIVLGGFASRLILSDGSSIDVPWDTIPMESGCSRTTLRLIS